MLPVLVVMLPVLVVMLPVLAVPVVVVLAAPPAPPVLDVVSVPVEVLALPPVLDVVSVPVVVPVPPEPVMSPLLQPALSRPRSVTDSPILEKQCIVMEADAC